MAGEDKRGERDERLSRLGQALQFARELGGETAVSLAAKLDGSLHEAVTPATVSLWESGTVSMDVETVLALEHALNLKPGTLLIAARYVEDDAADDSAVGSAIANDDDLKATLRFAVEGYRRWAETNRATNIDN